MLRYGRVIAPRLFYVNAIKYLYPNPGVGLAHWGRDKMAAIFQCIFLHENVLISIKISLKFVPKGFN